MNAIILCGGLSTRLGDITKTIPKVLLDIGASPHISIAHSGKKKKFSFHSFDSEIGASPHISIAHSGKKKKFSFHSFDSEIKGKTVLEWQLEKLKSVGITEVVLAAGHLAEVLYQNIGLHKDGVDLIYAIEQERLGTGGAIKHAWEYVSKPTEPTIILNGDVLTTVDLADMIKYLLPDSDGIILGAKVEDAATYGVLEYDKKFHLKKFKEKEGLHQPGYINGGIYLFNAKAKKYFPAEKSFSIEYDVFPKMTDLYVYQSDKPWVDIGLPERLEWARENWSEF